MRQITKTKFDPKQAIELLCCLMVLLQRQLVFRIFLIDFYQCIHLICPASTCHRARAKSFPDILLIEQISKIRCAKYRQPMVCKIFSVYLH